MPLPRSPLEGGTGRCSTPAARRATIARVDTTVDRLSTPLNLVRRVRAVAALPAPWVVQTSRESFADPAAFLGLLALASGGGDLTLVDGWGTKPTHPGIFSPLP
jgi:hypothetical protein